MPHDKLAKLQHELNTEPLRHVWEAIPGTASIVARCGRTGCDWRWANGQPEPTGCTGTDPEGTQ
jgi:hypothetical protein